MNATRWWKCDLQVATPAWDFRFPPGSNFRIDSLEERSRFLDAYMEAVREKGIEVIGLADHNTSTWIDEAKAAGERHGVIVFPGCEITTHTGADGGHLIILGDLTKTGQDFDRLLHGPIGFNHEHPLFHRQGEKLFPGTSSKTLIQILDDLPDGYLAIAPHVLSDNGIGSANTAKGDIRWRALHHDRLVAADPGDCSEEQTQGGGFNARFRRRELDDFPCLQRLPFIATSDAYSLEEIGRRFTWLRMGEVNLEALRQAFLDRESRVIPNWERSLGNFPDGNPNNIRHAWVSSVRLGGSLSNSTRTLEIPLHPNLNVIIGGRGSGKSSVVSALRQLYSNNNSLPKRLKEEADSFVDTVFQNAELSSSHHIQESQQEQHVLWRRNTGSVTVNGNEHVPTEFFVTVISQKELFERAAGDKNDQHLSSRSLLALLDGSIGYSSDSRSVSSYGRQLDDARVNWANAVRENVLMIADLEQLPGLRQRLAILQGQVAAFSSEEVRARLKRIDSREREEKVLVSLREKASNAITQLRNIVEQLREQTPVQLEGLPPLEHHFSTATNAAQAILNTLAIRLEEVAIGSEVTIVAFEQELVSNPWFQDVIAAQADFAAYKEGLAAQGLSASEFGRLQEELTKTNETIRQLEAKEPALTTSRERSNTAWQQILALIDERRTSRQELLNNVRNRSGRLRFHVRAVSDTGPWMEALRTMASFRTDAYLDDVPALATWLWQHDSATLEERWGIWRSALTSGQLAPLQLAARLRATFAERLAGIDETIRIRIASLIPDDVVMMEFLRENGVPQNNADWQSITQGSPGQRTAAMLAFVLHHGREPLVLDQPEDDLDSEWISKLVVNELRQSRWNRQLIVVSHNANIPVLGDAEQVIALENRDGALSIKTTSVTGQNGETLSVPHIGPVENTNVRQDIQAIMEGGVLAFIRREERYNNETKLRR